MTLDDLSCGTGGGYRFSRNAGRSLTSEALGAVRYPSPFFDIAQTYLPGSMKAMLRWCRYYFLTNPIINAVVYKSAEYPVTDLVVDSPDDTLRKKWTGLLEDTFEIRQFLIESGLDYHTYGNAFISIHYPFHKYLVCKSCGHAERVEHQKYVFRDYRFVGECQKCKHYGPFHPKDHYIRSPRDIRLIRWNPEHINIQHNDATGESRYYYTIPPTMSNDIRMGKRVVIERIPQVFIEALRENKALLFNRDNIYHMKRPTIAQKDKGWGMSMILPVLKDTFYLQILKKAQEAIALEHIVPMRVLYPQTTSSSADVYSTVNLTGWRRKVEQEITRWRLDNNYIPIMPLPIGHETLGGAGKALLLAQEYRVWAEHIIAGMGPPVEFVFGGLSYTGSNVSMRMLENHFLDQKSDHKKLVVSFIIPNVAAFLGWPTVRAHFKKFKMADDLQRSAFHLQMKQAGVLSEQSLLEDTDWSFEQEQTRIGQERKSVLEGQRMQALGQAAIQGEAQLLMQKYQMSAQRAMAEQQVPPMAMGEADQMQQAGMMAAGQPGVISPNDQGQMMITEQGMANQAGMFPPNPTAVPAQQQQEQQGPMPSEAVSPLTAPQGGPPPQQMGIFDVVNKMVARLDSLPDNEKQAELSRLRELSPQMYSLVLQVLESRSGAHVSSAAMPLPEQKPPRRGPEAAMI